MNMQPTANRPAFDEPASDGFDLRALYGVFLRRRWLVASVLFASLFGATLYIVWAPRIYRATARVFIEERTPRVLNAVSEVYESVPANMWNTSGFYKTQQDIIKSRPVAERIVALLDLNTETLLARVKAVGDAGHPLTETDAMSGLPDDLRSKLGLLGFDHVHKRADLVKALSSLDVVSAMQNRVQVAPMKDSRIADISVEDTSRERAALFANAAADAYVEYTQDLRFTTNRSAVEWLSKQLTDLRAKLQQSELDLYNFKHTNNIVSVSIEDRRTMIAQTLEHMNQTLAETTTKRIELEARREQMKKALAAGQSPESLDIAVQSAVIQSLKAKLVELRQELAELSARYTPEHPKVIATQERFDTVQAELEQEVKYLYQGAVEELGSVQDNETRLRREIESNKAEALELNRKEIEYRRLEREAHNNQDLLEVVLKREKEADLTTGLTFNNVRKFEEALVPTLPVRPYVKFVLAAAVLLGLVLAGAVAWLVDLLDNTLKSQQQIERLLSVPFLGIVPSIKLPNEGRHRDPDPAARDRFILDNPRSSVAECCRSIRTNLMFMSPEKQTQTVMVTSAAPREGKSTLVVNLSYALAQSGKRVLVVDADMRKPRLHKTFNVSNDFGISNLILGEVSLESAIQANVQPNLDVLTCGPVPPNPAELLHTESFAKLFDELKKRYDRIVFDSPPVAALSDALVLGSKVDGVALVVKANATRWPAAINAKRRLEGVGCTIYGVVLNDVDLDDRRSSEHYEQYYYYYRQGYGEDQAQAEKPVRV